MKKAKKAIASLLAVTLLFTSCGKQTQPNTNARAYGVEFFVKDAWEFVQHDYDAMVLFTDLTVENPDFAHMIMIEPLSTVSEDIFEETVIIYIKAAVLSKIGIESSAKIEMLDELIISGRPAWTAQTTEPYMLNTGRVVHCFFWIVEAKDGLHIFTYIAEVDVFENYLPEAKELIKSTVFDVPAAETPSEVPSEQEPLPTSTSSIGQPAPQRDTSNWVEVEAIPHVRFSASPEWLLTQSGINFYIDFAEGNEVGFVLIGPIDAQGDTLGAYDLRKFIDGLAEQVGGTAITHSSMPAWVGTENGIDGFQAYAEISPSGSPTVKVDVWAFQLENGDIYLLVYSGTAEAYRVHRLDVNDVISSINIV